MPLYNSTLFSKDNRDYHDKHVPQMFRKGDASSLVVLWLIISPLIHQHIVSMINILLVTLMKLWIQAKEKHRMH